MKSSRQNAGCGGHPRGDFAPRPLILSRRIARDGAAICECNNFDFDLRAFWQGGNLHSGTGWRLATEIRTVDLVYDLEIAEIGQENCRLQDVG